MGRNGIIQLMLITYLVTYLPRYVVACSDHVWRGSSVVSSEGTVCRLHLARRTAVRHLLPCRASIGC
jgi:hypothetical protein